MNLILMGAQGSGKSTQAQLLAKELKLPCLSTGNIFRQISQGKTELGQKIKKIMQSGKLVDDQTVIEVVKKFLEKPENQNGVIFEGYPRNLKQAENLPIKIDKVFYLTLSREEALRRLTARWLCKKCGENFNVLTKPPKISGKCDRCGVDLYQREDDKKAAVLKRLEIFEELTKPVLNFYKNQGILEEVNGEPAIPEIFKELQKRIKKLS